MKRLFSVFPSASCVVVPYAGTWIETLSRKSSSFFSNVVPYAGTWIETTEANLYNKQEIVVPYAGTWIETGKYYEESFELKSFPTRERGLKHLPLCLKSSPGESFPTRERGLKLQATSAAIAAMLSFPTRERGLKHKTSLKGVDDYLVVPYAGTWIETPTIAEIETSRTRRSLRGNVD